MQTAISTRKLETVPGMVFDVSVSGPDNGPLVVLLHGFGVSRYYWNSQVEALAQAGYFAAAPNQRGYSAGARPNPAEHAHYKMDRVIGDVLDIVDRLGYMDKRFHLVGHDWGGSLGWEIADRHPERLGTLTVLSRPHPLSFNRSLGLDEAQKNRSGHHTKFLDPDAGSNILAEDAKWLRERLTKNGVPMAAIEQHLTVLGNSEAMEAALAWYRARGPGHADVAPTKVPTLFIWGDADDSVGRLAAEGTAEFIDAPYQFGVLKGAGHFAADQVPEQVNALLLQHLARHPI